MGRMSRGRYDEERGMGGPPPSMNYGPPPPSHMGNAPPAMPPPPPQPPLIPAPPVNPDCTMKELNKMFGMTASDIDKYSRVIFPVSFISFQLMYWIIYLHLSDDIVENLVKLHKDD